MRLLMITRKIDKDDPQAGFIYNWVKKFGQQTSQLKVICLSKGNTQGLSENIEVFSMGKEKGKNRLREFARFQIGAWKFIRQIDGVFCHQNPIYTIVINPWAKLFNKKIITWYAHKEVNWQVKLINRLADKIVTSSEAGFRLDSKKKIIIGQGIDTDFFKPSAEKSRSDKLRIISVGRISPIKDYITLIKAADYLKKQDLDFQIQIIGSIVLKEQEQYFNQLRELVKENQLENYIEFKGGIAQYELVKLYQESDLAVNLCPTGAPDKAGLEAMACGLPLVACNKTFAKDFGLYANQLLFEEKSPQDLAEKIFDLISRNEFEKIGQYLRKQVIKHHNLDTLISKIINVFKANN